MSAQQILSIEFREQILLATLIDGVPHVAMKPICQNIGLDWEAQRQRIMRHSVLKQVACMIKATSLGADGKAYLVDMLMLPINYLNGWLFGVDAERVKPEIKVRLIAYQTECFEVLADHFMPSHPKPEPESQAPAFEHDPERVVLIREIATLTKRLVRCRNPMERQALGRCVMHLNEMAGFADHLNPLVLAELALVPLRIAADSDNGLILKQFWHHYHIIEALEPLNHTSKPGFIALNLAYVLKAFQRESLDHDVDKGRLYDALRASASPYPEFVKASFNLQSVLLPKQVVRTWLFKSNSEGALS